jgi:hypothetical protein
MMLPDVARTDAERETSQIMGARYALFRCDECGEPAWRDPLNHESKGQCRACELAPADDSPIPGDWSRTQPEHQANMARMQTGEALSNAFGVHPSQIEEAKRAYADAGVKVDFAPDGRARITSHKQERLMKKALGYSGD